MKTLIVPHSGVHPGFRTIGTTRFPIEAPASDVVAIVLAGSYHSTDSTFLGSLPRPLVPVAQVPVIGYVLRWLREADVARATICANSGSRAIESCVGDGTNLSMQLDYMEDATPRGPAGCARDAAMQHTAETFVVVDGTVIPDFDLRLLLATHRSSGATVTAVVHDSAGSNGEHRAKSVSPAGIYAFSRDAFDALSPHGFQDIKEHLIPALRRRAARHNSIRRSSVRVLNARRARGEPLDHRADFTREHQRTLGPFAVAVRLPRTASVHSTARLIGPVILGERVGITPSSSDPRASDRGPVGAGALFPARCCGAPATSAKTPSSCVGDRRRLVIPAQCHHGESR